ncbi:ATP-dependent Clp protease proteolytic subunit [Saccharothrix hoggarensis]|uniref:ATP-dependent Clp protease proteolytic subunit n=1 Tax=Saccharothrix hoggarensis TaxID=913853 RepID=A0ABW3QY10_9PSEU
MSAHGWALNKLMSDMLDDRTIVISGELGRSASTSVVSQLLLLNATNPDEDIRLYIDSAAGSLSSAFAICDMINWVAPEVSTWAVGTVESAATLVLCAGAPGKRYALPGSAVVLREPGLDEGLDGEHLAAPAALHRKWVHDMVRLLSERTRRSPDVVAGDLRAHRRLSAPEAVAYGIVDQAAAGGKYAPQGN